MQEFDCAQVSMNITDIEKSPIIEVFNLVRKLAQQLGVDTNGSELIGLIPLKAFKHTSINLDDAINYLGLNAVKPFSKEANIIEYNLGLSNY